MHCLLPLDFIYRLRMDKIKKIIDASLRDWIMTLGKGIPAKISLRRNSVGQWSKVDHARKKTLTYVGELNSGRD